MLPLFNQPGGGTQRLIEEASPLTPSTMSEDASVPKLRITVAEPPEAFDDLSVPLAGEYDDQDLDPHSLVVTGPFDGSPRLSGVDVAEVRLRLRLGGATFADLAHASVHVGGYIVTVAGEQRPFIGMVYLLR